MRGDRLGSPRTSVAIAGLEPCDPGFQRVETGLLGDVDRAPVYPPPGLTGKPVGATMISHGGTAGHGVRSGHSTVLSNQ